MAGGREPYSNLADLYDLLTRDDEIQRFYRSWRQSLLEAVSRYKVNVHTLVDLACGTGNSAIPWTDRGWTVVGVDRSAAMLREARRKSQRVRWYRQDIARLDLKERADVVTCHFDALNHILVPGDLQRVFLRVARILNQGGLFQFDLNTDHWLRWLGAHEKLFRMERNFMMAHNEYDRQRGVATFRQLWFVRRGRLYARREVTVQERAYSTAAIRAMIRKAGLRLLQAIPQSRLEGETTRILYLARKPSAH